VGRLSDSFKGIINIDLSNLCVLGKPVHDLRYGLYYLLDTLLDSYKSSSEKYYFILVCADKDNVQVYDWEFRDYINSLGSGKRDIEELVVEFAKSRQSDYVVKLFDCEYRCYARVSIVG
jgi:hypothetical protein